LDNDFCISQNGLKLGLLRESNDAVEPTDTQPARGSADGRAGPIAGETYGSDAPVLGGEDGHVSDGSRVVAHVSCFSTLHGVHLWAVASTVDT